MKKIIYLLIFTFIISVVKSQSNVTSINFDGTDDYVTFGDPLDGSLDFSTSESFTIMAFIKTSSVPSTYESIVFKRYTVTGTHFEGYILAVNSSGNIYFVVEGTDGNFSQMNGSINVTDGNWHCIVATRSTANDNINVYVDGILDVSMADNTTSTLEGSMNFYIGQWDYYGRYFNGNIDEVSVWNYAMSATDIALYINCPPVGNESNLISYWKLDEGTGTVVNESSLNANNDGTLQNNPSWSSDFYAYPCQVGVEEVEGIRAISIFPNPVDNNLIFEIEDGINTSYSCIIYDEIGKAIYDNVIDEKMIDVTNLAGGVYLLEITNGEMIYRQKFIKN